MTSPRIWTKANMNPNPTPVIPICLPITGKNGIIGAPPKNTKSISIKNRRCPKPQQVQFVECSNVGKDNLKVRNLATTSTNYKPTP
jgi:hypothetical protein